VLARAHQAL
jgi:DNA repair exonuclease SbcCD ATPase subunit